MCIRDRLEVSLSPEGSGMSANWLFDRISVSGTPEKAGTYDVSVTLTDKGQAVSSNKVELRIYTGDETLKGQFETLDGSQATWDMEPYEIWNSDNAVVPALSLIHIWTVCTRRYRKYDMRRALPAPRCPDPATKGGACCSRWAQ